MECILWCHLLWQFWSRTKIRKFIGSKTNIYGIQATDAIICGYFCAGNIDFMLKGKSFLDCTNLLTLYWYNKNNKKILRYFE